MKRRLDFAKKYRNMDINFWKKILWSDESKFNLMELKKYGARKEKRIN